MTDVKSSGPSRSAVVALLLSLGSLVAVSTLMFQGPPRKSQSSEEELGAGMSEEPLKKGYVRIGGVQRPETDTESRYDQKSITLADDPSAKINYGTTPLVAADANPQAASVAEALRTKTHPERLTPAILPAAFDQAKYEANPRLYIDTIEPGRVFQSAQPGEGVFPLRILSARRVEIEQGQSVPLRVRAEPGAPVTFTSFDLGQFENQLNSITVQADELGVATVRFTGSGGTLNDVNILAASPMNSGQAKFAVHVILPRPAAANVPVAGGV